VGLCSPGRNFIDPLDGDLDIDSQREEINLNYVTVTRAKLAIALHNTVIGMMREHASKANSAASG
jgi:hypothetical protein